MSTTLQVRMDSELKRQAEAIFKEIGVDSATAVRMFYHRVVSTNSIPFELKATKAAAEAKFEELILAGMASPRSEVVPGWADRIKEEAKQRIAAKKNNKVHE